MAARGFGGEPAEAGEGGTDADGGGGAPTPPGGVTVVGISENLGKMRRVKLPTLVLHGEADEIVPSSQGEALHEHSAAAHKRLVLLPGRGHNDLSSDEGYFAAIRRFCEEVVPLGEEEGCLT